MIPMRPVRKDRAFACLGAGPDLPFTTIEAAALETAVRRGRQGRGIQAPSLRPPIPFKPIGRASLGGMTTGGPGLRRSRTLLCDVLSLNGRASPDHKLAKRDRSTSPSSVCARKRELRPAARQRSTATCYKAILPGVALRSPSGSVRGTKHATSWCALGPAGKPCTGGFSWCRYRRGPHAAERPKGASRSVSGKEVAHPSRRHASRGSSG